MATMVLKKLGVLSVGKMYGMVMFCIALIIGIPYGLVVIILSATVASSTENGGALAGFGVVGGIAIMILLPIIYGIVGFLFGMLGALVFNVVAKFAGGIEMEFDTGGSAQMPANYYQQPPQYQPGQSY